MKRKIIITILCLTMGLSIVASGKQETTSTTETIPTTVESTQTETSENTTEPTEEIKETETENNNTEEIETTEKVESTETENTTENTEEIESTENIEETIEEEVVVDIEKGEPFSEKDLAFPVYGYKSYNEYIEAGNNGLVYMNADNANMIVTGELTLDPEDLDPKTTKMDAETATALAQQEGKEIDAQYGSEEAWTGYAQSQGADGTLGWCWIYYTGQGAGDQESYAVYMKEDSSRYGEVFHLGDYLPGGDFFVGANNKEHGIADDRELQRKYDNGELGDGITITENGDIIIE